MVNICGGILHARMGIVAAKTRHTNRGWWGFPWRRGIGGYRRVRALQSMDDESLNGEDSCQNYMQWIGGKCGLNGGCPIVARPAIGSWLFKGLNCGARQASDG